MDYEAEIRAAMVTLLECAPDKPGLTVYRGCIGDDKKEQSCLVLLSILVPIGKSFTTDPKDMAEIVLRIALEQLDNSSCIGLPISKEFEV